MVRTASTITESQKLGIVGSTKFGIYPDVSAEETVNMFVSDNWLVPYPGYKQVLRLGEVGRGLFYSSRANVMFAVIDDGLFVVDSGLGHQKVGTLNSLSGDVFMEENGKNQIAISDLSQIYVYNYVDGTFVTAETSGSPTGDIDFVPGYITFLNGYMISTDIGNLQGAPTWRLSEINNAVQWPASPNNIGAFSTKPDTALAAIRFPEKGNLLFIMGRTVSEPWYNSATAYPFPFLKSTSYNVDYGCLNPSTIGEGDSFVVWLASNEKSGPVITYSTGGERRQISNDGINNRLSQLVNPTNAYGFLVKVGGHLFYQFTFPDTRDNFTYTYDFNTEQFFTLCDENLNHHIAKQIVYFPTNNTYYFISFKDGAIYELNSKYTNYDYGLASDDETPLVYEIPRVRIPPTLRLPTTKPCLINNITFSIEQGQPENSGRIDLSISNDGGYTYSGVISQDMNPVGYRRNNVNFRSLGYTNEFTPKFRFNGFGRFVVGEGLVEYGQ